MSGDEDVDKDNDLVKELVKEKTHKFDKSFDKTLDKDKDKDEDEEEYYIYARSGFIVNNAKEIRHKPRRVCNECKFIKQIIGFVINKYTCKICNASKVKC